MSAKLSPPVMTAAVRSIFTSLPRMTVCNLSPHVDVLPDVSRIYGLMSKSNEYGTADMFCTDDGSRCW